LRVLHVVPTFFPATYFGGPIYSLLGLCSGLAGTGKVALRVLTTDSNGPAGRDRLPVEAFPVRRSEGFEIYYCRKWWGRELSGTLLKKLLPMIRWADVVHLTSVYSFSTPPTLFLCRLLRKPVIWSPRGQLQRWRGSRRPLFKRLWEAVCNVMLDPRRCVLHVTSQGEAEESRRRITRARVEVVANGVEIPPVASDRSWMPSGRLRLLFIGRLDPKKGIENLLYALKMLNGRAGLTICGAGEPGYEASLRGLVDDLALAERVNFTGHVGSDEKSRAFRDSDICVVPSYTENFAMVVAEALAHGVPVIASRGTPWAEIGTRDCGLWVENDPDSLARAIEQMRTRDLRGMGQNGRRWMQEGFSWQAVSERMCTIYGRFAGNGVVTV
jgi:glycosyltransferase involved in cell wall biosynthesis